MEAELRQTRLRSVGSGRLAVCALALTVLAGCTDPCCILYDRISVHGTVTLDGEAVAGWEVFLNDDSNTCRECGPQETDAAGQYSFESSAPGLCTSGAWEVSVSPPDSLAGTVTPAFASAPVVCEVENERDFAFARIVSPL